MKTYLICDNIDTQVGMRLAGVKGVVVHTREEVLNELNKAASSSEIGIILVTEKLASLAGKEIDKLKLSVGIPLVVVIPDRHGTNRSKDSITKYVKESIGLKI